MSDGVTPLKWSLEGDFISHNATAPGDIAGLKKLLLAATLNMMKISFSPFCTSKTGVLLNIDVNEIYLFMRMYQPLSSAEGQLCELEPCTWPVVADANSAHYYCCIRVQYEQTIVGTSRRCK